VPWLPELFSASTLERVKNEELSRYVVVPFFAGLTGGEVEPLVRSFAGEPEVHHPVRGRIKGVAAFERFVDEMNARLEGDNATVEQVELLTTPHRSVEEVIVHVDREDGKRVDVPVAITSERDKSQRLTELRIYYSTWPQTGRHAIRPPLLQPDPELVEGDVIAEYQQALAAGDVEGVVAAFEPDAYVREPAGGAYVHRGTDELRALFTLFFSNGGGIPLEHCTATDDGRACAIEYNVVAWGRTPLPPEAGIAVYVRGESGKLAAARIYDDTDPPLG